MKPTAIEDNFTYHPPKNDQSNRYQIIRDAAKVFASAIVENSMESEEQSLALRKVQEAVHWANAGIAINESHMQPLV